MENESYTHTTGLNGWIQCAHCAFKLNSNQYVILHNAILCEEFKKLKCGEKTSI